jgi:ATP-dependent HslUV protease ATP-binding subunit HslU
VTLEFRDDAMREIARMATQLNSRMENIGARRLHTVMTTLLEDVLYELPERGTEPVVVDAKAVRERLKAIADDEDLRKYIL